MSDRTGDGQGEVRLVAMTAAQVQALWRISEAGRSWPSQEAYESDAAKVRSLAESYAGGIDEATVTGSYLCQGCHDKLRSAFDGASAHKCEREYFISEDEPGVCLYWCPGCGRGFKVT